MNNWRKIKLDKILKESRETAKEQQTDKRLTVKLHLQGVHKREEKATDNIGSTVYFKRNAGQFIYGKQNLHNGAIGIIPNELNGYQSTQDVPAFDVSEEVDVNWLYYYFARPSFYKNLESLATGTGSKRIQPRELLKLDILVPSLTVQKKITEILTSVDANIKQTEAIIEQTEQIKKGLMQQLLTKGIGHTKFKKTKIGEIPEEWELVKLEDIATVDRGRFSHRPRNDPKFYGGNIPFVQTGDVAKAQGYLKVHSQTLNEQGLGVSKLFPKGTIIITIAANIGETAIASYDVCFPDSLVGIIPNEDINIEFLEFYLRTRKDYLDENATESAQKNINLQVLKPLLVSLPPKNEQERIASILKSLEKKIMLEVEKLESLSGIKKGLMQSLFTGNVRVKNDEVEVTQV
ncbi:restriction endonuclease subunit S [Bacillus cereus]|uniref:restriction endonuclease subunit S n=1 Tax=Bacillus cereus TaxID=1396 RepID=UPI00187E7D1A|nr:restriction endonuclease subunit S [Bacillus cereus]